MLGFGFKQVSQLNRFKEEFEDLGEIGSGGFADVHRVRHLLDNRIFAAKILKIKPSFNKQESEEKVYRVLSEPKAIAGLSHPNILEFHGCWLEVVPYSAQERQQLYQEQIEPDLQFEMILQKQSSSSDEFMFGSNSNSNSQKQQKEIVRHKRICKIGDGSSICDYKEVRIYLITQLCNMNLQSFVYHRNLQRETNELRPQQLLKIYQLSLEMISGLNYIHSKRMIHRDIKLHNVMLDNKGKIRLIDFGLAKKVKYWKTSIEDTRYFDCDNKEQKEDEKFSTSIGTKLFSSPEQASSEKYDYRTDIYSLAIVVVLLFNIYTTSHQQRDLLDKIRKRNLEEMNIPGPLKSLLFKSLGNENQRPSLNQLKKCIKELIRDSYNKDKDIFWKLKNSQGQQKSYNEKIKYKQALIKKMISVKNQ